MNNTSFEDSLSQVIFGGVDSDTTVVIIGFMAEAFYGIHRNISEPALKYLQLEITKAVEKFYASL